MPGLLIGFFACIKKERQERENLRREIHQVNNMRWILSLRRAVDGFLEPNSQSTTSSIHPQPATTTSTDDNANAVVMVIFFCF